MYDCIYLRNRISFNGKLKKNDFSLFDKVLKYILLGLLLISILVYIGVYINTVGFVLTLDLLFETLLTSKILALTLLCGVICGVSLYYCYRKPKYSVAFQVDTENNILSIVFNEGKKAGLEYHLLFSDISNLSIYKNGTFSMYCNNIEIERNGKHKYCSGQINFSHGDAGIFVSDFQEYMDRNVKYFNKNN